MDVLFNFGWKIDFFNYPNKCTAPNTSDNPNYRNRLCFSNASNTPNDPNNYNASKSAQPFFW